jgi:hypothetical protein
MSNDMGLSLLIFRRHIAVVILGRERSKGDRLMNS